MESVFDLLLASVTRFLSSSSFPCHHAHPRAMGHSSHCPHRWTGHQLHGEMPPLGESSLLLWVSLGHLHPSPSDAHLVCSCGGRNCLRSSEVRMSCLVGSQPSLLPGGDPVWISYNLLLWKRLMPLLLWLYQNRLRQNLLYRYQNLLCRYQNLLCRYQNRD